MAVAILMNPIFISLIFFISCVNENEARAQTVIGSQISELYSDHHVYVNPEQMPVFIQGDLNEWLLGNIRYPDTLENIVQKLVIAFVIDTNGKVVEPKIARSSGNKWMDNEGLRLARSMPNWKPGMLDGRKVRMSFSLPIQVCLE